MVAARADGRKDTTVLGRAVAPTQRTPDPRTPRDCYGAPMIEFNDFTRVDMRVGRIVEALPFPEARNPSYRLQIDFGPEIGERVSAAQLTVTYPNPVALVGRQVVAVVNFPPRRIAGLASEVLLLGAMGEGDDAGEVWLLEPNPGSPLGARIG